MFLATLLLGFVAGDLPAQSTDLIEINHCYNRDTGDRRFVQVIYWDCHGAGCMHVREWHMADKCQSLFRVPERVGQPYTLIRFRECDGGLEVIRAKKCRITHTFCDPEEEDRKIFPLDWRVPLGKSP